VLKRKKCAHFAKKMVQFCVEMALAIEYLHSRSPSIVIHRDIKPANFLLTASHRVKLGDFGIARTRRHSVPTQDNHLFLPPPQEGTLQANETTEHQTPPMPPPSPLRRDSALPSTEDLTSNCGTVRYMAPEVASPDGKNTTSKYSAKADVFSLALVYYFVWERVLPSIPNHNTPPTHFLALHEGKRPPLSRGTPSYVKDVINRMWQFDPNDRPSASELLDDLLLIRQRHGFSSNRSSSSSSQVEGDHNAKDTPGHNAKHHFFPSFFSSHH